MSQPEQSSPVSTQGSLWSFRLVGVPIRLHFTFVILLAFLIVTGLSGSQSVVYYVLYLVALFASVLLHELAHAFVGGRYGIRTLEIVMFPIGGVSRMARDPRPSEEFWIAMAGPAVNFAIAGVMFGILLYRHSLIGFAGLVQPTDMNLIERIALGNLILAVFNLIPAFPMDGGRMLRSVLARFKSENESTRIASRAGILLAIAMAFYGLLAQHYLLVFVAFFIYLGAAQENAAAMGRTLTAGMPIRTAMVSEFHTLSHGSTVRDAANLLLATSQQDFPVVYGNQILGLLGRNALLRAMAREGQDAYVSVAMDRNPLRFSPDQDLAEVLPQMAQSGSCALVMDEEDNLVGLLTAENVSQFLMLRRFGMQPEPAAAPVEVND